MSDVSLFCFFFSTIVDKKTNERQLFLFSSRVRHFYLTPIIQFIVISRRLSSLQRLSSFGRWRTRLLRRLKFDELQRIARRLASIDVSRRNSRMTRRFDGDRTRRPIQRAIRTGCTRRIHFRTDVRRIIGIDGALIALVMRKSCCHVHRLRRRSNDI